MANPGQSATIGCLGEALLQKILGKLKPKDQGRAACASRAFCEAVAPLAPALRHFSATGRAGAVLGLLVKAGSKTGLSARHPAVPESALHLAARRGRAEIVSILLTAGMRPDKAAEAGTFPLALAAGGGHASTVKRLLGGGASVDLADEDGSTALWKAASNGRVAVVSMLLEGGASLDLAAKDGTTPLYAAARGAHVEVVSRLQAGGASVDLASKDGTTPLWTAAQGGHLEVVSDLIMIWCYSSQEHVKTMTDLQLHRLD